MSWCYNLVPCGVDVAKIFAWKYTEEDELWDSDEILTGVCLNP